MAEEENLYAPPEAELSRPDDSRIGYFYVVSMRKFTLLFFLTMSLYLLYWFYAHWHAWKLRTHGKQWPVPRALFNIFFTYSLFRNIEGRLRQQAIDFQWSPGLLAAFYIILEVGVTIADRLSLVSADSIWADLASFLLLPLLYMPIRKAQKAANAAELDPEGTGNSVLTAANYIWLALGALLWLISGASLIIILTLGAGTV